MRIYHNFEEAFSEVRRDLKEMGIKVHTQTYQNKHIGADESMATLELQNYVYRVNDPDYMEIKATQPWANLEFGERINERATNPGKAWKSRQEVWKEFLNKDGKFDYTYSERLADRLGRAAFTLIKDPMSRQVFVSVWAPDDLYNSGGVERIPCTLGYYFQIRGDALHITYLQRSADFSTHFFNDVYLAGRAQMHLRGLIQAHIENILFLGDFTHWVGSLHVFQKDVKEVF